MIICYRRSKGKGKSNINKKTKYNKKHKLNNNINVNVKLYRINSKCNKTKFLIMLLNKICNNNC